MAENGSPWLGGPLIEETPPNDWGLAPRKIGWVHKKLTIGQLGEALETLGALLEDQDDQHELVLIGGGALLLLGVIDRPTEDLDVVARVDGGRWESARPLPSGLKQAIRDVASALDLPQNWLNSGAAMVLRVGLPDGFADRMETRCYGGLIVHLASRRDQIAFKLDAASDKWPDRGRHLMDLQALCPSAAELVTARAWCQEHRVPDAQASVEEVITFLLMGGNDAWV